MNSSNGRLFQTYMQHLDVFVMGDDVEVIDGEDCSEEEEVLLGEGKYVGDGK